MGDKTLFDLSIMNACRATQAGRLRGQGGVALRGADLSCRVLLLEWVDGELCTLDLVGLARAALELARVVATKA